MNKKIIGLTIFLSLFFLPLGLVFAQGGGVTIPNPLGSSDFGGLLEKIADGVGTLIATLGTIMIIVAGILYLLSAGSPDKINTAKKALVYAIAGIAIGLAAKAIVAIVKKMLGA